MIRLLLIVFITGLSALVQGKSIGTLLKKRLAPSRADRINETSLHFDEIEGRGGKSGFAVFLDRPTLPTGVRGEDFDTVVVVTRNQRGELQQQPVPAYSNIDLQRSEGIHEIKAGISTTPFGQDSRTLTVMHLRSFPSVPTFRPQSIPRRIVHWDIGVNPPRIFKVTDVSLYRRRNGQTVPIQHTARLTDNRAGISITYTPLNPNAPVREGQAYLDGRIFGGLDNIAGLDILDFFLAPRRPTVNIRIVRENGDVEIYQRIPLGNSTNRRTPVERISQLRRPPLPEPVPLRAPTLNQSQLIESYGLELGPGETQIPWQVPVQPVAQ